MPVEAYLEFKNLVPTLSPFKEQRIQEIASCLQESKGAIDRYSFTLKDNHLYSPTENRPVLDVISTDTLVGKLEYQAVETIEQWFLRNNQGAALWLSPPDAEFYPDRSKMIASEIVEEDGEKKLLNRVIMLELNAKQCLERAQALAERSLNRPLLSSIHHVRSTPLMLGEDFVDTLAEVFVIPEAITKIKTGQDIKEQARVLEDAEIINQYFFHTEDHHLDRRINVETFFGEGRLRCPFRMGRVRRSAFNYFSNNSLDLSPKLNLGIKRYPDFPCPNKNCDQVIESGKGITQCPKCHHRKEDYAKCA